MFRPAVSTGDLVVRLRGLFHSIDTTIESVYLTRADVVNGFAWTRCRPKRHLIIHYLGLDAKPAIIKVTLSAMRWCFSVEEA